MHMLVPGTCFMHVNNSQAAYVLLLLLVVLLYVLLLLLLRYSMLLCPSYTPYWALTKLCYCLLAWLCYATIIYCIYTATKATTAV